ncbi:MAG: hypothetical protein M0042_16655 [Nitrospiraceae bacterium]|nr:hypothetical protein [Nitrospiraceae bacterium]
MSTLVRFAYDKESLVGWRAIIAVGILARATVEKDPIYLRETCRKLLWSLTDESGGIGWSAPEMLGEIVSADPSRYSDVIPLIASAYDIEEDVFRPGVMYALGRIAEEHPDRIIPFQGIIERALGDKNATVRAFGVVLLIIMGKNDLESGRNMLLSGSFNAELRKLLTDSGEVWIYEGNGFVSHVISELASKLVK